ncbi:MAG: Flp family type IVb pilin [Chloroflexi bacterium]|nr:Flp family type IVb pilin [Chloroflexota bacterium]
MSVVRRSSPSDAAENGQGLVEYGLILVLIAIVCILALVFIGDTLTTTLSKVGASV